MLRLAKQIFMPILGAEDGVGMTQTSRTESGRCVISKRKILVLLV